LLHSKSQPVGERDHGVLPGDDVGQGEGAVAVTLIAAKEGRIVVGILRNQDNHRAGEWRVVVYCGAIHLPLTGSGDDGQAHRSPSADIHGAAGDLLPLSLLTS